MPPKIPVGTQDIRAFFSGSQPPKPTEAKRGDDDTLSIIPTKSKPLPPPAAASSSSGSKLNKSQTDRSMDMDVDINPVTEAGSHLKRKKSAMNVMLSSDSDTDPEPPKKKHSVSPGKAKAKMKPKRQSGKQKADVDFIDDDVLSATEEVAEKPKKNRTAKKDVQTKASIKNEAKNANENKPVTKKSNFAAFAARRASGPAAPGSKAVPDGQPNCLAGLTLVFTGELTAFSRDEATDLAKRYGARVTGQPSSKTSYVVVGADAGASKLAAIKKNNLPTLDEDGFLNLIGTREGIIDDKTREKIAKEEAKIREAAKELERREKTVGGLHGVPPSSQLWTTKYAPQSPKEICGNKGQVEKLQGWLHDWQGSLKASFKKPGKTGMNTFRAVMITGSPGIGKTTSAHICARLEGYTPIELNASDARSKKLVENATNISNTSLDGWISGGKTTLATEVEITNKSVLIMDEVDGMSAGDRGGVGALNALIKKTKIPIICIANDRQAQKLKPLLHTTFNLSFKKPDAAAIRSRIMSICFREGMKIPGNVVDQLVQGAQSDIRQVINMLSTWKLSNETMDFDQGKALAKMNEKYMLMTPWGVMNKILGPYAFSPTARETLNDKMDLYFQDHSFVPMFMQENYAKIDPARSKHMVGPERDMKKMELLDKAASSLSDGDLVDGMIHSSEQHWSLMPLHAVTSTVRPAYYMYGQGGYQGANAITFPMWFGQNSKQSKLQRQLADVQIRMRLKVSGDKTEIRQSYAPALHSLLVQPLIDSGASVVDEVIECMDGYYLSKDEWDTVVELGVGDSKDDKILKKISSATKAAFTKKYNSTDHPIAFHKSADLGKVPKKLAADPLPDLEEAFDLDEPDDEKEEKKPKDPTGIADDKLLKLAGRGKTKATASRQGKGKK
ncbi:replication factor RFC1 C terminal domain-containing protein [Gautieria morchelliformis]|nr:replication factor RFC1 C terminal domain-containing protein [Gautieria morchelliformis]